MAERPYFKKTIEELEEMYAQGQEHKKIIKQLLAELKHRKTQRAQKLKKAIIEHQQAPPAVLDIPADPAMAHEQEPAPQEGVSGLWGKLSKSISSLKH